MAALNLLTLWRACTDGREDVPADAQLGETGMTEAPTVFGRLTLFILFDPHRKTKATLRVSSVYWTQTGSGFSLEKARLEMRTRWPRTSLCI
eukprot:596432-Prorocentrum_minimum.AAC.4